MAATENGQRTFDLSVVTPEGTAFEGEAQMLIVPGAAGEIGVLARHAPLVAMLKAGEIRIRAQGEWQSFAAGPGYFGRSAEFDETLDRAAVDPRPAHGGVGQRGLERDDRRSGAWWREPS